MLPKFNWTIKSMLLASSLASLLMGFGLANWLTPERALSAESAASHAKKHEDPGYICPMHHQITSKTKDTCPICSMALVRIKTKNQDNSDDAGGQSDLKLNAAVVNSLSVRMAAAREQDLVRFIDASGYVEKIDKGDFTRFTASADGVVTQLIDVDSKEWVKKGTLLYILHSNQFNTVQQAYLDALETDDLMALAKSRLQLTRLGFSEQQISNLQSSKKIEKRLKVVAPHAGTVTLSEFGSGVQSTHLQVTNGTKILDLIGKSRIKTLVNVFQRDTSWIKPGVKAELYLRHLPGESWSGVVTQDTVRMNASTRNISSRLVFSLPGGIVKPGTQIRTRIYGETLRGALVVPSEALIQTEKEVRVVIGLGKGRFRPVSVTTGAHSDGYTEILTGLKVGDKVVASSQFLIDSESQLQASFKRMQDL